jgi:hypothetical protein
MIKLARDLLNAVVCTRVQEPQEALSAGTIALEISSPQRARRSPPIAVGAAARAWA